MMSRPMAMAVAALACAVASSSGVVAATAPSAAPTTYQEKYGLAIEPETFYSCKSVEENSITFNNLTDSLQTRCMLAIPPKGWESGDGPLPVLILFVGMLLELKDCGTTPDDWGYTWVDIKDALGFVIVCLEPVAYEGTGVWTVPLRQTDETGPACSAEDSPDNVYLDSVLAELDRHPDLFLPDQLFLQGCSGGSAAAFWQAVCLEEKYPGRVRGFGTHSTGLKVKGDGIDFISAPIWDSEWAECDGCQYYPVVPQAAPALRACVFDNKEDPSAENPFYYNTSVQLAEVWAELGNPAQTDFGSGGHCSVHNLADIAICLDDGTGELIPGGYESVGVVFPTGQPVTEDTTTLALPCTDEPPTDDKSCGAYYQSQQCAIPILDGYCCSTCHGCYNECMLEAAARTTPKPSGSGWKGGASQTNGAAAAAVGGGGGGKCGGVALFVAGAVVVAVMHGAM